MANFNGTTADLQRVAILGSTGTVGVNTLDVVRRNSDRYKVQALTANTNAVDLHQQCLEFKPRFAVLRDPASARQLSGSLKAAGCSTEVLVGGEGLCEVACHEDTDVVMAAIVGAAGLASSLAAAKSGKRLRRIGKNHYALPGYETRKKGRAHVIAVDVDGEEVPIADVKAAGSKFVRRRARGG